MATASAASPASSDAAVDEEVPPPLSLPALLAAGDDLAALVLSYLDPLDDVAGGVARVSRALRTAARSDAVWHAFWARRWRPLPPALPAVPDDDQDQEDDGATEHDDVDGSPSDDNDDTSDSGLARYRRAFQHPHDLWIEHANIVWPWEGLAAGRCGRRGRKRKRPRGTPGGSTPAPAPADDPRSVDPRRRCPTCRLSRRGDGPRVPAPTAPPRTRAQAVAEATRRTQRKLAAAGLAPNEAGPAGDDEARVWTAAGTQGRRLHTGQYRLDDGARFLTDLLFFNLVDADAQEDEVETDDKDENDMKENVSDGEDRASERARGVPSATAAAPGMPARLGAVTTAYLEEPTQHSWHVARLRNVSFHQPIVFEIVVQRPDCFASYPAQGYLAPGATVTIIFSVTARAARLLRRAESEGEASAAATGARQPDPHLPLAPYMVRYRFAVQAPLFNRGFMADPKYPTRRRTVTTGEDETHNGDRSHRGHGLNGVAAALSDAAVDVSADAATRELLDFHWPQRQAPFTVRTIVLSAHVHTHYNIYEFWRHICRPYHHLDDDSPRFIAPCLQERFPKSEANRILTRRHCDNELTEGPCSTCYRNKPMSPVNSVYRSPRWGARDEESLQAYVILKGECAHYKARDQDKLHNIRTVLLVLQNLSPPELVALSEESVTRSIGLLYRMSQILKAKYRTACLLDDQTRIQEMGQLMAQVDAVSARFMPHPEESDTNQFSQSKNGKKINYSSIRLDLDRKGMTRSARVGSQQEDQNHLNDHTSLDNECIQIEPVADIINCSPYKALQTTIGLIKKPEALIGIGLYDRLPYPGTLVRRPKSMLPALRDRMDVLEARLSLENFSELLGESNEYQLWYYKLMNGLDVHAIADTHCIYAHRDVPLDVDGMHLSMLSYIHGVPPPGVGRFPLCQLYTSDSADKVVGKVLPLHLTADPSTPAKTHGAERTASGPAVDIIPRDGALQMDNVPRNWVPHTRLFNWFWRICSQLGLVVDESVNPAGVVVDRRILIAGQWMSISLMAFPLIFSLLTRYFDWMPTQPLQQELRSLLFDAPLTSAEMRYLTRQECGAGAIIVMLLFIFLGRAAERSTGRDFFRALQEHVSPASGSSRWHGESHRKWLSRVRIRLLRLWDVCVPELAQQLMLLPPWNSRSLQNVQQHAAYWSSRQDPDLLFSAAAGHDDCVFGDVRDRGLDGGTSLSLGSQISIGLSLALGSFCCCTPHLMVNLLTVVTCGLGFGMSVALHIMDRDSSARTFPLSVAAGGRAAAHGSRSPTAPTRFNLMALVILSILLGQLVGSSGGAMFLAEFVVTLMSLLLGGAGTISTSSLRSWMVFSVLGAAGLWASLLGRVALTNNVHLKRTGAASTILSASLVVIGVGWGLLLLLGRWLWVQPVDVLVQRAWETSQLEKKLQ